MNILSVLNIHRPPVLVPAVLSCTDSGKKNFTTRPSLAAKSRGVEQDGFTVAIIGLTNRWGRFGSGLLCWPI